MNNGNRYPQVIALCIDQCWNDLPIGLFSCSTNINEDKNVVDIVNGKCMVKLLYIFLHNIRRTNLQVV